MSTNFAKMDRKAYNDFCKEITDALAGVAKKHGVAFKVGNGKYDHEGYTMKTSLEISTVKPDGSVVDKAAVDFKFYAPMCGMKVEWLGQVFSSASGKKFTISGFNSRRTSKPVFAKGEDGKTYIFPTKEIIYYMTKG